MAPTDLTPDTPRWLHWLAVLTVIASLPLLVLGAEVTTKKVGMIDPAPVRSPLHLIQVIQEHGGLVNVLNTEGLGLGWLIEHSHRTVGWLVGLLAICLAVGLTLGQRRRWLRWAGWASLLGVGSQGVLGMLRVELNRRVSPGVGATVALIHGCTAQLVLALLVSIALWTSRAWQHLGTVNATDFVPIRRASLALVGVMYLQIVFGAIMRHKELALGTRMHILLAFAVVGVAAWLGVRVLQTQASGTLARRGVWTLWCLLALQLALGLETLLSKFDVKWGYTGERLEPVVQVWELVRSIHFLVGALTFATAVAIALLAHRHVAWALRPGVVPGRSRACPQPRQLEGAV